MRHFILVPLLGLASTFAVSSAQANDGPSRREQAAQAQAELDRKFTPAFARENLIPGTTTRDQVIALYGDYYRESISQDGTTLNYNKQDIRNRTTSGIRRFAQRVSGIAGLADIAPGAGGGSVRTGVFRATAPVTRAGGAASSVERARNSGAAYNSMDDLSISFDSNGKVFMFSLN